MSESENTSTSNSATFETFWVHKVPSNNSLLLQLIVIPLMPYCNHSNCEREFVDDNSLQQVPPTSSKVIINFPTLTLPILKHRRESWVHRKPYHCSSNSCNRSFKYQSSLDKHTQALHLWCDTCSKGFISRKALNDVSSKSISTRYKMLTNITL